jgi:uncharacterized protein YdeI (YjbR/CyaY-like superfamily)
MKPTFFTKPAAFRAWLEKNHETKRELLVGFYRKSTGRPSITWEESVAEALCFGWIDGVRRRVDDDSYSIRFTPRTATSTWSSVNIATMNKLIAEGRACPAGLAAFERRKDNNSEIYSYEQRHTIELDAESERLFRANKAAWKNFQTLPNWYRRVAKYRVMSAKRPETKAKRLNALIAQSAKGERPADLDRTPPKRPKSRGRAGKA